MPPHFDDCAELFFLECSLKNLADRTIMRYRTALMQFGDFLEHRGVDIDDCTKRVVREFLRHQSTRITRRGVTAASVSVNGDIRTLRVFFNIMVEEGEVSESPMKGIRMMRVPETEVVTITAEQMRKLLQTPKVSTFVGRRDRCLMMVLYDTGMRLGEALSLTVENVDIDNFVIHIKHGKGGKNRVAPFGGKCAKELLKYRRSRPRFAETFFCSYRGRLLERGNINDALHRYGAKVGMPRLHAHLFRHTFCTEFLRQGGDLETLRRIVGHSGYSMLRRYVHLLSDDLVKRHREVGILDRI